MAQFYSNLELQPAGYKNNFACAWVDAENLTISQGMARDSNNVAWVAQGANYAGHSSTALTINSALSGAGGLDTGTIAVSSRYAALAVLDSSGFHHPVGLLTLVAASGAITPVLPLGYDSYALVSYAFTDSSAEFIEFLDFGFGNIVTKIWVDPIRVLSGGTAFDAITGVSGIPGAVPYSALILDVNFTPATANDTVNVTSYGLENISGRLVSGTVAAKVSSMEISKVIVNGATNFAYLNSAASCATSIYIVGFEFNT